MRICPKCRTTYPSPNADVCVRDGAALVDHSKFVEAENDPLRGKLIGGRYTVVERVGQGGMGMVYRAEQAGLNRPVAIKILKQELNVDPDTVARFHREANAMSKLTHANTVRVYDFGQTDDGLLYLVMELLEGEQITEKMSREGCLRLLEAIRYTQQILRSLAEAHSQGIVHRDLKPDNIFLARVEGHDEPIVKVLDFGIAKVVAPDQQVDQFETQAGTVFGTPRYMSPEQAQGAPLDARSDLYSVGTLLYQMITGRPPFVDDDAVVVMAKHIREMPEAPSEAAPDRTIPSRLEATIMVALEKDPQNRFSDCAAFDQALEDCIDDVLLASGLPPRRVGDRPTLLYAALGLIVVAAGAYGLWRAPISAEPAAAVAEREPAPESPAPAEVEEEEAPVPAKVALRSDPSDAQVLRDGEVVGTTPLDLWVEAGTEFVRIELRKDGFQPLMAEVTATEGERLLELVRAPEPPKRKAQPVKRRVIRRVRRPKSTRRQSTDEKPARKATESSSSTPPNKSSSGPYERFD